MWQEVDNRRLWQSVVDTVGEGLVAVDARGVIRHLNRYAAESLRISPERARERHFSEVFCPSLPKSQCWVNQALQAGEKVRDHRFWMEHPDGHTYELVGNLTPIVSRKRVLGALISIRYASEPRREGAQHESHSRQAILASMAEGLFTVDNEWRITSFNRAAERMTGWQETQVLGQYCNELFGPAQCAENCPLAATLKQGTPILDFEATYHDRDGNELRIIENTAVLYNSVGEAVGGVVSFRRSPELRSDRAVVESHGFCGLVGESKAMRDVYQMTEEVADSKATVLILGESGTGKELVANAIQALSPRKNQPFVKVNCAAIPDTLLESELFGHVKGAFTDASTDRVGRFALADGGTIFLDEVGDLSPPAQLRLLRVLEEGEFQRLGSSETVRIDVRVIAATNRNLWRMVQRGDFRDDLYYRLNVIQITLPPLRQRREDLPLLIEHFMARLRERTGKMITQISPGAMDRLLAYDYPGNVRELENLLEHAFARTRGSIITEAKLPPYLARATSLAGRLLRNAGAGNRESRLRILSALQRSQWNRERAARELGISRTTLWRRMRQLGL